MTAPDSTIAARVPLEHRAELNALVEAGHYKDLGALIRTATNELAARHRAGNGNPLIGDHAGAARRSDPSTSKAAARDVAPRSGSQRRRALEVIRDAGAHGATTDEVIEVLDLSRPPGAPRPAVNGVARRVTDLLQAGAIETVPLVGTSTPATRKTRHGSDALVYVVTAKGRAWLEAVA
jgi:Arc/MetJ-type ribon-helix-helix transcriptional regulator